MQSKAKVLGATAAIIIIVATAGALLLLTGEKEEERKEYYILYTFEDRINNSAWEGVAADEIPKFAPEKYINKSFDASGYNAILASDDELEYTTSLELAQISGEQEGFPYQLFRFKITVEKIETLSVTWEGFGKYFLGIPNGALLYIWNDKQSNWVEIGNYSNRSGEQIIAYSFANASAMIANEDFIFILAYCKIYGAGKSTSELATDYIELKIVL